MTSPTYSIGIDTGGTFTDVVAYGSDGAVHLTKVPSTPEDPGAAVRRILDQVLDDWGIDAPQIVRFVHGTTVATNAVLERKGARIGLLTTEGFKDVLEIGRQNRTQIYDLILRPETPGFLVPGARRRGVLESIGPTGEVEKPLDEASLAAAVAHLVAQDVDAIAICFLFSFANPVHERQAAAFIAQRHPEIMISLSSDVDPAFREYERTCVTAFDAYIKPRLDRYLAGMEDDLKSAGAPAPLQIMQSRGGVCSSVIARRRPVRLFLSGPAAGVIGACAAGAEAGLKDLITVDIGGTSSDIALIFDGQPLVRPEGNLDTYAIRVPMVDVNAIGAGGGSIAWIDEAGGLRVGPKSAGADPGPACYGRGGEWATVTDASVALGYIDPGYFAGGSLKLDQDRARAVIRTAVAEPLGMSPEHAALGIHRVVNAQMAEGIRLVSISRGIDPRQFALVALGGAGPLHATALAGELGIGAVVVPRNPGVLSASGLLSAITEHEVSAAFPNALADLTMDPVHAALERIDAECAELMAQEQAPIDRVAKSYYADVCYVGQAHYMEVPLQLDADAPLDRLFEDFCALHERQYGHHTRSPAKIVNLRTVHRADTRIAEPGTLKRADGNAHKGRREIIVAQGRVQADVYDRDRLNVGDEFDGPAIIEQNDTTTLVEPGWRGKVGEGSILVLTAMPNEGKA
ncbi:hydantoinase/oxoprolinase family protein [Fodinicurvata sp. EGI_FJ10296]|uniref:hydantoinase/oxoprolinase family protein n=1 Tax=Fodinicurvata sp. EGI_FJ10296 TaxID=3231908 RepID=UPI00345541DF